MQTSRDHVERYLQNNSQSHLQVWKLPEGLAAHIALVLDFAILLLQRIRQCLVTRWASATLHFGQVYSLFIRMLFARITQEGRGRLSGQLLAGRRCAGRWWAAGGSVSWSTQVGVHGVWVVRPCFVFQSSGGWKGTGGSWKEEVSVARNRGGAYSFRHMKASPCWVRRQEGHMRG